MAETKPYIAPNGKHVVKLKARFEQHNAGEICGFEEQYARELVAKGYADYHPRGASASASPKVNADDKGATPPKGK